jgi:hypothetical protein
MHMALTEYTYRPPATWQPLPPAACRLPADCEDIGATLYAAGYFLLAESGQGDGGIGAYAIWQHGDPDLPTWPYYVVELRQWDDVGVVWLPALPQLWEFCRRYGQIGWSLPPRPEPEASWICPECLATRAEDAEDAADAAEEEVVESFQALLGKLPRRHRDA